MFKFQEASLQKGEGTKVGPGSPRAGVGCWVLI
jgi:hypothetical protein